MRERERERETSNCFIKYPIVTTDKYTAKYLEVM